MSEMDISIRNVSGDPDELLNSLYDFGGMGVLRFGDEFRFLCLRDEGGYVVYNQIANKPGTEHVALIASSKCAAFMEKLASQADQLFHVGFCPGLDICLIMLGAEQTILSYYPPDQQG
jgi:hypothetical protein